jgi:CysZ protein
MLKALGKAFGQTFDPAFRRVFWLSLLASLATFVVVWFATWLLLGLLGGLLEEWLQGVDLWAFVESALLFLFDAGAVAGILIASFFLFPSVMVGTMSLLLERIARAVEARHYPDAPPAREQPVSEAILSALALAGVTLLLNLLVLPLYFIPLINVLVFLALNGYLLGREYFELVAQRRMTAAQATALRRTRRARVFLAGVVIAFLITIPLVNLITPIIATAFMLHIYEGVR